MLQGVVVVLCMALAATASTEEDLPWYKKAVLYQVYPRSFKDSNGDGVGDLKGITEKAAYLKEIGVDAIWISPILKSPMADFGYDISDYREIDRIFGTHEDFKQLAEKLEELGIKLLLDLVPNHTSDLHEWFQKSAKKQEPYTDYYVWHDGKEDPVTKKRVPPNNWTSVFSGPAWEWHEGRQQFYLHQFLKEQPDLNFRNPAVVEEMDEVIRFWLKAGVDGFRIDAVPFLIENEEFLDELPVEGTSGDTFANLDHRYTQNQPETFSLLSHWADVVYNYSKTDGKTRALFLEAYADLPTTIKYYGHGHQSFMQPFNFQLLTNGNQSVRPDQLHDLILDWMNAMSEADKNYTPVWVIGNHDQPRIANKYGPDMVDAMNLLSGILPGVKVVYNGEELGMRDTYIRWDQSVDTSGLILGPHHYLEVTRDPERTPMQWDDSPNAGFSTNKSTWLPVNPNYWWLNVDAQKKAASSHLKVFQALTVARQDPVLQHGDLKVYVPDQDTLLVVRRYQEKFFALIVNMGSNEAEYTSESMFDRNQLDTDLDIVVASINSGLQQGKTLMKGSASLTLRPKAAVLLKSV